MPFQPIDFSKIAPQGLSGVADMWKTFDESKANQIKSREDMLKHELEKAYGARDREGALGLQGAQRSKLDLENELLNMYGAQEKEATIDQKKANALASQFKSQFPGGGLYTGPAAEIAGLQYMTEKLGEDHPDVQMLKKTLGTKQETSDILNRQREGLIESQRKRASTPLGKMELERKEVEQGFMPGTNGEVELTPEEQQTMLVRYELATEKSLNDPKTRERISFANNIHKTIKNINLDDLTQYGGIIGQSKKTLDQLLSAGSITREEYARYEESKTNADLLAKQSTQFYGDSIQPAATEAIKFLANPESWKINPEIARRKIESFIATLESESETYRAMSPYLTKILEREAAMAAAKKSGGSSTNIIEYNEFGERK